MPRVEIITDLASLEAVSDEWAQLDASLTPRLPFTSPDWLLNWWRAFRRSSFSARDMLNCYAIRDGSGELIALAPMYVTHRPGFGPVRARELQFFGADPYVTEWRGLVCRPERAEQAFAALRKQIEQDRPAEFVQWRGVPAQVDTETLGGQFESQGEMRTTVFYLELPDSWEAFRGSLSRNIKESLRKCYNSLARDKHECTLRVISAPEDAPAALDRFFHLHDMRASATDTINHPNVFADQTRQDFLRFYCQSLAQRDQLRVFELVVAGHVVASRIGFLLGDEIYMYFSGYDLAWGKYSVMTTTVAEAIKWAIDARIRIFNLSTGSDVSKTRWRPSSIQFSGGYEVIGQCFGQNIGQGFGSIVLNTIQHFRTRQAVVSSAALPFAAALAVGFMGIAYFVATKS